MPGCDSSSSASVSCSRPSPPGKRVVATSWKFCCTASNVSVKRRSTRSEEHTSELQSRFDLVCRLLLEKKTVSRGPHAKFSTTFYQNTMLNSAPARPYPFHCRDVSRKLSESALSCYRHRYTIPWLLPAT